MSPSKSPHGRTTRIAEERRGLDGAALYEDDGATLDELREAVTTLEDTERIARRVLGNSHPSTTMTEEFLRDARATLHARETPSGSP